MSFVGALQIIVLIPQPKLFPNCKKATIDIQLWNWDHLGTTDSNIEHLSSPCPWTIIHVRIIGNCPSLDIILLHICNLGRVVFTWSILSWTVHMNSSFDWTNFVFHVWYKLIHDYWCRMCFISFISYSISLLLCFPNLNIKSLRDSQTLHFAKTNLHLCTSMLRWCLFLNLLIIDWEIPLMLNSLLICDNTNKSINQIRLQKKICKNNIIFKYMIIFGSLPIEITIHQSSYPIISFLKTLPWFKQYISHILLTIFNALHLM
jgi:hypothetical protein